MSPRLGTINTSDRYKIKRLYGEIFPMKNVTVRSKSINRTDTLYLETKEERKVLKLSILIFIYIMYEDDLKLSFKEKILVKSLIQKNKTILSSTDIAQLNLWVKTRHDIQEIITYAKTYNYRFESIEAIINKFKKATNDDPSYQKIIEIIEEKFNHQRGLFH
jgi:hypothetical protein